MKKMKRFIGEFEALGEGSRKPERPFPLKPETGFAICTAKSGYPKKDESYPISGGRKGSNSAGTENTSSDSPNHDAIDDAEMVKIFDGLVEGDFYGR